MHVWQPKNVAELTQVFFAVYTYMPLNAPYIFRHKLAVASPLIDNCSHFKNHGKLHQ